MTTKIAHKLELRPREMRTCHECPRECDLIGLWCSREMRTC